MMMPGTSHSDYALKTASIYARCLFAALIVLTSLITGSTQVTAQELSNQTTFVSEITGDTLDIGDSGDWEIVSINTQPASDGEYAFEEILINSDNSAFGIQILGTHFTPKSWEDATSRKFAKYYNWAETLGQSDTTSTSTRLFHGSSRLNVERISYSEYQTDASAKISVSIGIYSNADAFLDDMESLRTNVTLEGEYVFADVDMVEIEAKLNGTSDIEPKPMPFELTTVKDWSSLGLVSETEWQSPDADTVVTWNDDALSFPFHNETGLFYDPETSEHTLTLTTPDFRGAVDIKTVDNVENLTLNDWSDRLSSEEYIATTSFNYPIITEQRGDNEFSIIYSWGPSFGWEIIVVRHVFFDENGNLVTMDIQALPEDIEEIYLNVAGEVSFNGELIPSTWAPSEITDAVASRSGVGNEDSQTETTRTPRSSSTAESATSGDSVTAELSGVTIDLGPSGEAKFYHDGHFVSEGNNYALESFTVDYGTTVVIIDLLDGELNVDEYMQQAESDIAATYDYMDWLGGEWTSDHSWDVYSGAYKLDYREHVYLDLVFDPASGMYYGIGIYGSAEDLPTDIAWLQDNITIDGEGILASANSETIETVINGSGEWSAEPVPMPESSVADWSAEGLISETEWHSPFTTTSFTWDGTNIVFPFAQSDALEAADGVTTLELRTGDRRGEIQLSTSEVDYAPSDWVETYTSEEYLESQAANGQPVTILNSHTTDETGGVISLYHTNLGDPVVVIMDVHVNDDGVTVLTEISASPEDIAEVYAIFWDSVQSNGEFYPLTWSIGDIETLDIGGSN